MGRTILATSLLVLLFGQCAASAAPAPERTCTVFLDKRITYLARQRAVIELAGYVHTGDDAALDRDATFRWWSEGGYVVADSNRKGRAFFHPGYRQGLYVVHLDATSGGLPCVSDQLRIEVDVDYVQYLQLRWTQLGPAGSRTSTVGVGEVRIVDEFTQLLAPLVLTVDARRVAAAAGAPAGESNVEVRAALKLFDPRIYVGMAQ